MSLYFIAVTAPVEIDERVLQHKRYMLENYGCRVALKSPAHITLVPPFTLPGAERPRLEQALDLFAAEQADLRIELNNFAAFRPRVIYVNVVADKALEALQAALEAYLIQDAFPVRRSGRTFHPHMTVANRDLQPHHFEAAWNHFRSEPFSARFAAGGISLLHLVNGRWERVRFSFFHDLI